MKKVSRAIIVNNEGKVLVGKRARGAGEGLYALIGGKPEGDETAQQAVIREVEEEIGLNFNPTFYLEEMDVQTDNQEAWCVTYFTGQVTGELRLAPSEVVEVKYVDETEVVNLPLAFNHKKILSDYFMQEKRT